MDRAAESSGHWFSKGAGRMVSFQTMFGYADKTPEAIVAEPQEVESRSAPTEDVGGVLTIPAQEGGEE